MATPHDAKGTVAARPPVLRLTVAALVGLGFSAASTWVHYQILRDPLYSSVCDVSATFSCTNAYTSRFGSVAGIPVALIGVVYFAAVLGLVALCQRSASARQNLAGYVFALSTLGLAGVLYLGYASWFVLNTVCLLCVGTYVAVIALFITSGSAARYPLTTLPSRASRDVRTLLRTPAALGSALAFVVAAVVSMAAFRGEPVDASAPAGKPGATAAAASGGQAPAPAPLPPGAVQQLEQFLAAQPRVPIVTGGGGATVVIVKFNDYQCPPCGQTYLEYKPVLARLQQKYPGKIAFMTKDFPLDPECNTLGGSHQAACEAAVAVRLAREKGRAEALEDWLFANQAVMTPEKVREGAVSVGGVANFSERYATTLELVRGDIAQGVQLSVRGTPTFFMNGIRLPNLRGEFFEAAVEWELRRVAKTAAP
jgi:uncharacterized membrane protein/protein-disulfide isomerase